MRSFLIAIAMVLIPSALFADENSLASKTTDAAAVAGVYRLVFETYPFPIHQASYIAQTMEANIAYFGVFEKERLIAVSSAEMDSDSRNVEMTDFATLPECRGKSLATVLLHEMEKEMAARCFVTAYTIARALSYGMNITFGRCGYRFAGTLFKNTNISGGLESMNVWFKRLPEN